MLDMEAKLKGSFDYRNNDSCKFGIRKKEEQTVLHFPDGTEFSVLNNHASKALETLLQRPTLEFEAIGSVQAILETIERVTKANDAVVRVSIHIYGPRESKEDIGNHLTNQKLYLQRPDKLRVGATYENPHFLSFADMQISSFENQLDVGNNRATKLDDPDKFRETISNVYASLTRGENLSREVGDRRLKTKLLK
jgi:SWI/SNF-related matrix-associated actin-dependent regulator of chromatin subfamily A3